MLICNSSLQNKFTKKILGSEDEELKAMYEKSNEQIEKLSGIVYFFCVTASGFVLPKAFACFFVYFTTDKGNEAFELSLPLWWVFLVDFNYCFNTQKNCFCDKFNMAQTAHTMTPMRNLCLLNCFRMWYCIVSYGTVMHAVCVTMKNKLIVAPYPMAVLQPL